MCYNVATENAPWNDSLCIPPPTVYFHTQYPLTFIIIIIIIIIINLTTMSTAKATRVGDMYVSSVEWEVQAAGAHGCHKTAIGLQMQSDIAVWNQRFLRHSANKNSTPQSI